MWYHDYWCCCASLLASLLSKWVPINRVGADFPSVAGDRSLGTKFGLEPENSPRVLLEHRKGIVARTPTELSPRELGLRYPSDIVV
jgi:hypothetical protein